MAWISPTGFVDSDSKWTNEARIYDGSVGTSALCSGVTKNNYSSYIEITHAAMICEKVRFYASIYIQEPPGVNSVDVDVYYSGAWHDVFEGAFTNHAWVEKAIGSTQTITAFRFRFKTSSDDYQPSLHEVEFSDSTPIVTIQDLTNILTTSVMANGNITYNGGSNCTVRGFKYGLTQTPTWDVHDGGDFSTGAYTKAITGLLANTTYWVRAYTTNPVDTVYSAWVQFQTSASGVIPTGTKIFVCSDYSAFTYQLQRSEMDDGEEYIGYFVINTDLAEKRGLTIYKRVLDLHLYFKRETSGTAEIYAKRDSETEWQYLGSVSLTDDNEPTIIVKHLAVDIKAKDYDFKVAFNNACRFLGVVFEFLPGGTR